MTNTIFANKTEINRRIDQLASEIITDFDAADRPLFVALLRGAAPFASKLMFAIAEQAPDFHPELDYMMVSTYGSGQEAGEPHIVTDLAPSTTVAGRVVIILDDVLDKGITAHFVTAHMIARGAGDVRLAVLADKQTERVYDITPQYVGFSVDDAWLIGMGMDDSGSGKEYSRWLGSIEAISQ
jgi:hypoxanthine phosphoribosyltransferase